MTVGDSGQEAVSDFEAALVQTRAAVEARAAAQLDACQDLQRFVVRLVKPWQGRPIDQDGRPADLLVAAVFMRSFATYSAAVELERMGYATQAAMLNRSLFEDMVDVHWIRAKPELAVERFDQHHEHGRMLLKEAVLRHPQWYSDVKTPDFDPARRGQLDRIFGDFGEKSWTGLSLHKRLNAVLEQWDEDEQPVVRFFRDIPHAENNKALHVSAHGLARLLRANSPEELVLTFGPDIDMLDRALMTSYWTFIQIVGLILDYFDFDVSPEERSAAFSVVAFVKLDPKQIRDTPRNAPCPCGSGRKFKRCHGA